MDEARRKALVDRALAVRQRAYAPYSRFLVGAAVVTASGETFVGCNVENAAYGLTVCAERVALATAVAAGERHFSAMAIASAGGVTPCGACRQVLVELAPDLELVLVDAETGGESVATVAELLPRAFRLDESGG
jgi:cytidine deaminase